MSGEAIGAAGRAAALRRKLLGAVGWGLESRTVFRSAVIIVGFVVLAKLGAAFKEVLVASAFGTGASVDAYNILLTLASVPMLMIGQSVNAVLLPVLVQESQERADACFRQITGASLLVGGLFTLLIGIGVPAAVRFGFIGLTGEAANIASAMSPVIAAVIPFGIASSIFACRMMARGRHINALYEVAPSVTIIVALSAFGGGGEASVLFWSTSIGYFIYFVAMVLAQPGGLAGVWPTFSFDTALLGSFWPRLQFVILSQLILYGGAVFDQVLISHLEHGAVAIFGYANRLLTLGTGVISVVIGRAMFPVLSAAHQESAGSEIRLAARWVRWLFPVSACAAVVAGFAAPTCVGLLLERGAFHPEDTEAVAELLKYGLWQIPFFIASTILAYAFASRNQHSAGLLANLAALIAKIGVASLLVGSLGVSGVMISTAVSFGVCASCFVVLTLVRGKPRLA